jgi:hypothetical protein
MKWALVVYFLVNGGWHTAESLNYDGWHRMHFESQEICKVYEKNFNETVGTKVKGVCELDNVDLLK